MRLPGQYPIVPIRFDYKKLMKVNEPFVARAHELEELRENVLGLAENLRHDFSGEKTAKISKALLDSSQTIQIKNNNISVEKISSIKDRILE
jgi:hypothetical protein